MKKSWRHIQRRIDKLQSVQYYCIHSITVFYASFCKTLQMLERYSHKNGSHIQAAVDKLEWRYQMRITG